jgi:hypothetical protein
MEEIATSTVDEHPPPDKAATVHDPRIQTTMQSPHAQAHGQ